MPNRAADRPGSTTLSEPGDRIDRGDWYGLLELWPGTNERVLIRRVPFLEAFRQPVGVTYVAALNREGLARAALYGRNLWRDWRRNNARVADATGEAFGITPTDWAQVFLPELQLDEIRRNVLHFAAARELYARTVLPYRRGLLFYGPPGNGKTMICRAIVTALGWPVVYVSPHSRKDAADEMLMAFEDAKTLAPCVMWFDDIDSAFDSDATVSSLLNRLDGATTIEGLLVIATTNQPDRLDPAIVARPSRFDRLFEIGPPASIERDRFFAARFGDNLNASAREELVQRTSGMSMAFIQEVFVGAALRALDRGEPPSEADALDVHESPSTATHARRRSRLRHSDPAKGIRHANPRVAGTESLNGAAGSWRLWHRLPIWRSDSLLVGVTPYAHDMHRNGSDPVFKGIRCASA